MLNNVLWKLSTCYKVNASQMKWKVGGFDAIMTDPGTVCQLLKRSLRDKERKSSGER